MGRRVAANRIQVIRSFGSKRARAFQIASWIGFRRAFEPAFETWCILHIVKRDPLRIRLVSALLLALLGIGAGALVAPHDPGRSGGGVDVFTCDWIPASPCVDPQRLSPDPNGAAAAGTTGLPVSRHALGISSPFLAFGPVAKVPLRDRLCVRLI